MEDFKEVKVMDGVYVTDFRSRSTQIEQSISPNSNPDVLRIQIKEMENSIKHLIRSNIELESFLQEAFDQDFKDALDENKVTIQKKGKILKELQKELEKSLASRGEIQKPEREDKTNEEENGVYL